MTNNLKGALLALTAFASYSLMDGSIKYITDCSNLSWQILIFYVSLIILIVLFLSLIFSKNSTFKVKRPFWLVIRAIIGVTNLHLVFFIVPKVNLDLFYSLIFIAPIIASILATFVLGEHMNIHKLISIALGFIGILIITKPWDFLLQNDFSLIQLIPILVALTDAAIGIVARKYLINDKATTLVFYQFILCTILSGFISFSSGHSLVLPDYYSIFSILVTAFFALFGYLFYIRAVQVAPVQIVLPMGYSQMVFGVFISIVLFSQYPKLNIILGAIVIIIASLYMLLYASITKTKKENQVYVNSD